jgi:REP element-mobilizing transposase RayT
MSAEVVEIPNKKRMNFYERKANNNAKNKIARKLIKQNKYCFITDFELSRDNIHILIQLGRTRWRIENGFNSLKKCNYNFEHNFGHGKSTLSNVLAVLLVIAYLIHAAGRLDSPLFREALFFHNKFASFVNDMAALSKYIVFKSLTNLYEYMIQKSKENQSRSP